MSRIAAVAATLLLASTAPALAAPATTIAQPAPASAAAAVAGTTDKAGCGVLLMVFNEIATRHPQILGRTSSAEMGQAFFRMAAHGGKTLFDQAMAEGAAEGKTPSAVYQAGVASMMTAFSGVRPGGEEFKQRGMALTSRCLQMAAPAD
ncbi:hypothetical protein ABOZ73_14685 [Caulobacter sp. 73W]|uniref:Uncharacterized protein n=1 Tax=Caulobacter sp. 73W TaxID=3161137 RepID=A0AB39KQU2_9CAUL